MIYDVNSPLFRSFLSQKGGASDKRKTEEQRPKEQRPKASDNKPVMNEVSLPLNFSVASSSATTTEQNILILKSSDRDEFEMKESIAVQSVAIKNMVEDGYSIIPLLNVNTRTLTKIIEYMKKHADDKMNLNDEDIKNFEKKDLNEKDIKNFEDIKIFDKEFVNTSFKNLFEVLFAANYLNIKGLFEFLCQTIADRIKNKSVKAVRKIFNVTNDYTEEAGADLRARNGVVYHPQALAEIIQ